MVFTYLHYCVANKAGTRIRWSEGIRGFYLNRIRWSREVEGGVLNHNKVEY
jgi:hypothetical protein